MTKESVERTIGRMEGKIDSILEQVKKTNGNVRKNRQSVLNHDNRIQTLEDCHINLEKTRAERTKESIAERDAAFKRWTIIITIIVVVVNILAHYLPGW